MGQKTKIEWATHTFNPWIGCTKVSPACDHCYAEAWDKRFGGEHWGPHAERRRTSFSNWDMPRRWDVQAAIAGTRPRVFCASLADVFDNQVPSRWRDDLWHLIDQTRSLDWLLLTKRPQNIAKMLPGPAIGAPEWGAGWPNVWLGTTAESQEEFDRRKPILAAIPAAQRFLSVEPMLGAIDADLSGISWVIVGGESGPNARPMHPDWARGLRDQCVGAGVAFHFKQWGHWHHGSGFDPRAKAVLNTGRVVMPNAGDATADERADWPRLSPEMMAPLGKKAAGRLLDGREWNEVPA